MGSPFIASSGKLLGQLWSTVYGSKETSECLQESKDLHPLFYKRLFLMLELGDLSSPLLSLLPLMSPYATFGY